MIDRIAQLERENRRLDNALRHVLYYARLDLRDPHLALARIDEAASQVLAYAEPFDPVADRAERMRPLVAAALRLYETLNDPTLRHDRLAVREALDGFNAAVEHYQQEQ